MKNLYSWENFGLATGDMSDYSLKRFVKKTLRLDPALQQLRLMSELPSYLSQVVVGLLLSDGSVSLVGPIITYMKREKPKDPMYIKIYFWFNFSLT